MGRVVRGPAGQDRRRDHAELAGEVVGVLQRCVTLFTQLLVVLLLLWGILAVADQVAALLS